MDVKKGAQHAVCLAPADSESLECPHALILFLNITLVIGHVQT